MKLKTKSGAFLAFGRVALLACCALALTSLQSSAALPVNLGDAGPNQPGRNWAVFSLGGTVTDDDDLSGSASVIGDIGVYAGKLTMSGNARVTGTAYLRTGSSFTATGSASVTGGIVTNAASDAILEQGQKDAVAASKAAFALSASVGYPTTINANSSLSLSATGNAVLKLTDFTLANGALLTLNGSSTSSFVINVSNNFSLTGGSQVKLTGGLQWNNVLFNYLGAGTATVSNNSQLNGILLAANSAVNISDSSSVRGEVIAQQVTLSGVGAVTRPPIVSP